MISGSAAFSIFHIILDRRPAKRDFLIKNSLGRMSKFCSLCDILFFFVLYVASLCKNDACGTIKALLIFKGVFIRINGDSDVTLCTQSNSFIGNPAALEYIMYCLSETKGFPF